MESFFGLTEKVAVKRKCNPQWAYKCTLLSLWAQRVIAGSNWQLHKSDGVGIAVREKIQSPFLSASVSWNNMVQVCTGTILFPVRTDIVHNARVVRDGRPPGLEGPYQSSRYSNTEKNVSLTLFKSREADEEITQ